MSELLAEIISILVGGITSIATGIGTGLQSLVTSIFVDSTGDTTQLTTFGGIVIVFAGVSFAIGLCRWVMNFVTSLGASK